VPSVLEVVSVLAALGSFVAAAWVAPFARRQVRSAEEQTRAAVKQVDIATAASQQSIRASQIQLIIQFANTFHAIRGLGVDFSNNTFTEQFWGLFYLEFFYFHHGEIPETIFGLWMVELASLYSREPDAWRSHEGYLGRFANTFQAMYRFYQGINAIAGARQRASDPG
jgi:hypothetical protein